MAWMRCCNEFDPIDTSAPPIFRCTRCGHVGEGAEPHISVRAMILSLSRFGIATAELTHALEKEWAAYRQGNGLDLYRRCLASPPTEAASCEASSPRVLRDDRDRIMLASLLPCFATAGVCRLMKFFGGPLGFFVDDLKSYAGIYCAKVRRSDSGKKAHQLPCPSPKVFPCPAHSL